MKGPKTSTNEPPPSDGGDQRGRCAAITGDRPSAAGLQAEQSLVQRVLPFCILIGLSGLAYSNAGHKEFFFDSAGESIANARNAEGFGAALRSYIRREWNPDSAISYLTFPLNVSINRALGLEPFEVTGFLVFNVVVHAINACLVYLLIRALLRAGKVGGNATASGPAEPFAGWIALACAALFAVHPVCTSSVVYIIQRRGMMATMFYILAMLSWLKARASARGISSPAVPAWSVRRIFWLGAVVLCGWLSFRSKSIALTLPVAILALEFCLRATDRQALRRLAIWTVFGLPASILAMFLVLWRANRLDLANLRILRFDPVGWGPWAQLLTESRVFLHYWKLLLLPLPGWLCIDHDFTVSHTLIEHGAWLAVLLQVAFIGVAVLAALRGYTLAAFGVFWFYIALMPYALLPEADLLVEYKIYLPGVGMALILAELLRRLQGRVSSRWQLAVLAAVAAAFLTMSLSRNRVFQSPLALWTDAVAKSPHKARSHYNLGNVLADQGRLAEALSEYQTAARLDPHMPMVFNNLGITFLKLQRWNEAAAALQHSIEREPSFAEGYVNLATALGELDRREEALAHYRRAIELRPDMYSARHNLVLTLIEMNRLQNAEAEALKLAPDPADARCRFAALLAQSGHSDEALAQYHKAVELAPRGPGARRQLAIFLLEQNRFAEAVPHLQQVVREQPDADSCYALAVSLAKTGRGPEAAAAIQQALRINPNHAAARAAWQTMTARPPAGP